MPRRPARSTVSILPAQRAFLTALVPASQVERLLVAEPENAEYVELKAGLVEVIAMTEDLVDGHPDAKPREAGAEAKANEADASVIDETVAGALCRVRADGAESLSPFHASHSARSAVLVLASAASFITAPLASV